MKRENGGALVEFAMILPLMLILVFVTTEFGRAYYQYNTLTKAVREAARYLSVRAQGVDVAQAKNIVVYGTPAPAKASPPVLPNLDLATVDSTWTIAGTYPVVTTVTVTVSGYTFKPMVSSVFGFPLNTITFSPIRATMRSPT